MKRGTREDVRLLVGLVMIAGAGYYLLRGSFSLPSFSLPSVSDFIPSSSTVRDGIASTGEYAGQAAAGAIEGVGLAVGIPRTNLSECQRAKAEGRWWDASFACPAGDFISSGASAAYGGVFGSTQVQQATQADVRRIDNAIDYSGGDPFVSTSGMDYRYF